MPIFVETCRATVAPSDCDHLGHMNVQHYFATVSDGMFASDSALARKKSSGARFRLPSCTQRLSFTTSWGRHGPGVHGPYTRREVRDLSPPTENVATGTIAMITEFKCVLLDLEKRKAISIPDAAATQLMTDQVKS